MCVLTALAGDWLLTKGAEQHKLAEAADGEPESCIVRCPWRGSHLAARNGLEKQGGEVNAVKLENKVAIVTGAGRGIGRAIALCFAREGADVVIPDIKLHRAAAVAGEVESLGRQALAKQVDVAVSAQVDGLVEETVGRFGKVDILVNNAGIGLVRPFYEQTDEEWDRVIKIHLYGCFYFSRAVSKHMIERKEGKILNIASISGVIGSMGRGAYGAAKGGIITLTKVMAVDLAKHGINVNAIAPGPIKTRLLLGGFGEDELKHYCNYIPFKRLGEPNEVADAALFLCSTDAKYITGHVLPVDGGFLAAGVLEAD